MVTNVATIDLNKEAHKITLTVKMVGQNKLTIKLWVARQLIKLASHVVGMNVKFEEQPWYKSDI